MKRKQAVWFGFAVLVVCGAAGWLLWPSQLELPDVTARSVAVMDVNRGTLLYEKDGDTPRAPASLTKLMTLFLVLDDIEDRKLDWEDRVEVLPSDVYTVGSKYGLQPQEVLTVRQLVAGTALCSGCDCVQCLVRVCGGNEAAFVQRMNEQAEALGLKGSRFENATGVDALGHYMTAENVAQLCRALVKAHPELLDFTGQSEMTIGGYTFQNLNDLVGYDTRVKGLKTGTTAMSGYSLATYAEQDGQAYIIVLLDSNNDVTRFTETEAILEILFGKV